MPLDKAIEHNKEKRKPYYKSNRFDRSCRNHGSCGYCLDNRMHRFRRAEPITFDEEFEMTNVYDIEPELDLHSEFKQVVKAKRPIWSDKNFDRYPSDTTYFAGQYKDGMIQLMFEVFVEGVKYY